METSLVTIAYIAAGTIVTFVYMVYRMHSESSRFINELQFFLKQRTIAHNRVKAQKAVLETKFQALEKKITELESEKSAMINELNDVKSSNAEFQATLSEYSFLEEQSEEITQLGQKLEKACRQLQEKFTKVNQI